MLKLHLGLNSSSISGFNDINRLDNKIASHALIVETGKDCE